MALSRKRKRELSRLKGQAEILWGNQKDVLEHASQVVREARRQATNYAKEEVTPRVRERLDDQVKPAVAAGLSGAKLAASTTRGRIVDGMIPAVSTALGSALSGLEVAKDPKVRAAFDRVVQAGSSVVGRKATIVEPPTKSAGPGRYIFLGISIVTLAGVAYAAWQTLRADDDLWIDDDEVTEPATEIQPS